MKRTAAFGWGIVLETDRLLLRPLRVSDAGIQRELWCERDLRVPAHRRIDSHGRPTVEDLADRIRNDAPHRPPGLIAVELKASGDVIGYCGLIDTHGPKGEPELAFELLRKSWHQGFATEASRAVLSWAATSGYRRIRASVWDWNVASRRVLEKLGFIETHRGEINDVHGSLLFMTTQLHRASSATGGA